MSAYLEVIKKQSHPYMDALKDDIAKRRNPNFFWPTGTQVYCGRQGSGKTISAVKHLLYLKQRYPLSIVVSNLKLNKFRALRFRNQLELKQIVYHMAKSPEEYKNSYILFSSMDELAMVLTGVNNGFFGVIYIVDEIHTYFNALESKNVPMFVFTEISQQRKQRKLIIGTSQLFLRMAKPLREQCDNLIVCHTIFGVITVQKVYDGMTLTQDYDGGLSGKMRKLGWFIHNKEVRENFDTYQKVVSGAQQYEEIQRLEITSKSKKVKIG